MTNPRIVFQTGGPSFHPVDEQARAILEWLGTGFTSEIHDGAEAFDHLAEADLLVLMGLHWTGIKDCGMEYRPLNEERLRALEVYVASGRPLLVHHGAIASYDDRPRYGELLGFTWVWGTTQHSPIEDHTVRVLPTGHPIVAGVADFPIHDELYYDIRITEGMAPEVHAEAEWHDRNLPMIMTAHGGRVAGAGRTAYLANGHDMKAFESPAMRRIWTNAVRWLLHVGPLGEAR